MGWKRSYHDQLILDLLEQERIKVEADEDDLVLEKSSGRMIPKTKIYIRDMRIKKKVVWREQVMHPNIADYPRFSIHPNGRKGKMVWLLAARVVWYSNHRKRTPLMVCPIDGDPWNYHISNLCLRDKNEQNYIRELNKGRPPEDETSEPADSRFVDNIPF